MLTLSIHQSRRTVKLGTIVTLSVERADASVEARIFLRQGPVFYPRPLVDWSRSEEPVLIFPESPGQYGVEAHWRRADGATGRESLTFEVEAAEIDDENGPRRVQLQHFPLWVPSAFEARAFESQDPGVGDALARLVKPGEVVYDVGANVGYYAAHFARLVGPGGHVVCLEANPVCAYFLRANLIDLGFDQARILPAAALHVNGMTRFSVNYGNTNLGTAETSGFFHHKPGQEIAVGCFSLDHLMTDFGLPAPDFLKIDVEGAELQVLEGMDQAIRDHRPTFLLELHGAACTQGAITLLAGRDYRFENPATHEVYASTDAARAAFGADSVYQVVARPPR